MRHSITTFALMFALGCSAQVGDDTDSAAGAGGDSAQATNGSGGSDSTSSAAGQQPTDEAPAFIATMTHLESGWNYDGPDGDAKFDIDVLKIRTGMDIFSAAGGIMTVESEVPFSTKALALNSPIFTDLLAANFGVGSHCDIKSTLDISDEAMAEEFLLRKEPMDLLIGANNNLGCSGGASKSDWVLGAHLAGFKYINGIVGMHYLSMDEDARPEGWTDDSILNGGHFHDVSPVDLAHRMHPFMMADATDFEPDADGVILANPGELGSLPNFAELEKGQSCSNGCALTSEDVDVAIAKIEESLAVRDAGRVFKVDLYLPLMLFTEANRAVLESFIEQVNTTFVETGRLQWGSQRDVYEAYVAYNATAP